MIPLERQEINETMRESVKHSTAVQDTIGMAIASAAGVVLRWQGGTARGKARFVS